MKLYSIKKNVNSLVESKVFPFLLFFLYFLIPFIVYKDYIVQDLIPTTGDGIGLLNIYDYVKYCIKNKELPLWNSLLTGGMPYAADISMGSFYPVRLLLAFLPLKWFWYCYYALHLAIGSVFFYKYLLEVNCNKVAALCTSVVYYFSIQLGGMRKSHLQIITCVIFLPIVLYLIERYFKTLKVKFLLICAMVMAIQFLLGFPQLAFYTDVMAGIYIIVNAIRNKVSIKKWLKDGVVWGISYLGLIAVQVLPFLEMTINYNAAGAGETTFEIFKSFSMHPMKLLMMLFPKAYGENVYDSISNMGSSGLDIEIFLGSLVLSVILFSIIYFWKDYRVRFSVIVMIFTFLYIMNGCYDILAMFFYKLPVINSFRVPSRSIFIFIFFGLVLFAYGMTVIINKEKFHQFSKFLFFECIIIFLLVCFGLSILSFINDSGVIETIDVKGFIPRYQETLIVLAASSLVIHIIYRFNMETTFVSKKIWGYCFIAFCTLLTLKETYPFWRQAASYVTKEYGINTEVEHQLSQDIGNGKLWLANPWIIGSYESMIKDNANIPMGLSAINSYTTFNNPRLSKILTPTSVLKPAYNSSGLYTGFLEAKKNIIFDNAVFSMLGVKYIIDQEGLIDDNQKIVDNVIDSDNVILTIEEQIIPYSNEVAVFYYPINIKEDAIYQLSFECEAKEEPKFYFDLSGENYSNIEQVMPFSITSDIKEYNSIIESGESLPEGTDLFLRLVVTESLEDFKIKNMKLKEMKYEEKEGIYKLYYQDESMKIYENLNCKDILYVPSSVERVSDEDEVYNKKWKCDFDDVSYVVGVDSFDTANANISELVHKSNSITAKVEAQGITFVNFSQAYYPGWRAYIDGTRTELYMVNGLIQGIRVPEGTHEIVFSYQPTILYIGWGISALFAIGLCTILLRSDKKKQ